MKRIFYLALSFSFLIACSSPSTKETAHERVPSASEAVNLAYYGDSITTTGALPIAALTDKMAAVDSLPIKVSGKITSTCSKKGCWMKMAFADDKELRITFKDYAFFVPTKGVEGKTAIVKGFAKKSTTDIATLKHYAKDAGKSPAEINSITSPKEEIVFVASGVIIKD